MKTTLFFDTETTGLPDNYNAPYTDVNNWPRLVQLAWILYHDDAQVAQGDFLIKPEGFIIPTESSDIHNHDHEKCMDEGVDLKTALNDFWDDIGHSDVLIAHNIDFDKNIVGCEYHRAGAERHAKSFMIKPMFCTRKASTEFCKLPGKYGFKWPKLEELYLVLFSEELENTHDALVDSEATAKCYFELKRRGIFS
jgi:DNA polymerase III epsilon subunit-like protein